MGNKEELKQQMNEQSNCKRQMLVRSKRFKSMLRLKELVSKSKIGASVWKPNGLMNTIDYILCNNIICWITPLLFL